MTQLRRLAVVTIARLGALALIVAPGITGAGLAIAASTAPVATLAAAPSVSGVIYTADEKGGSISMIDLDSGRVETTAVPIMPHNVQISADGKLLYAVGTGMAMAGMAGGQSMGTEGMGGKLLILDSYSPADGAIADIAVGPHPAHVVVDKDGTFAYVTDSEESAVQMIDLAAKQVTRSTATGAYPHGLRLSPDGRELYVANLKDGSVSVVDVASFAEVARIKLGKAPAQVGFTPDGSKVFISLNGENKVAVVDRATRQVVQKLPVGRNPVQVYATPDGRYVYVANQGTEQNPDSTVSVIDVPASKVVATVTTGKGAHGVVVSDDGKFAFVTNIVDGTVSALDTATQTAVRSFKVGAGPNGITYRGEAE
jgi:YVTN family beta-propeller protein